MKFPIAIIAAIAMSGCDSTTRPSSPATEMQADTLAQIYAADTVRTDSSYGWLNSKNSGWSQCAADGYIWCHSQGYTTSPNWVKAAGNHPITSGRQYVVTLHMIGRTTGSVVVVLGGDTVAIAATHSGTSLVVASSTATPRVWPTADFDGGVWLTWWWAE